MVRTYDYHLHSARMEVDMDDSTMIIDASIMTTRLVRYDSLYGSVDGCDIIYSPLLLLLLLLHHTVSIITNIHSSVKRIRYPSGQE